MGLEGWAVAADPKFGLRVGLLQPTRSLGLGFEDWAVAADPHDWLNLEEFGF